MKYCIASFLCDRSKNLKEDNTGFYGEFLNSKKKEDFINLILYSVI